MSAAEWLRSVARRSPDDDALVYEAADALASWAREPASLVVACRRLLAHHPGHGPLWCCCARVLTAPDPARAAHDLRRDLDADRTAEHLARALPLLDADRRVAVAGWSDAVDRALAERFDLAPVAVRQASVDVARRLRRRRAPQDVPLVSTWDLDARGVDLVLVEPAAVGGDEMLAPAGTDEVLEAARESGAAAWLVAPTGRVLPHRLFEAMAAACAGRSLDLEPLDLSWADRAAGPRGVEPPAERAGRADGPVAPELLRPLD